MVQVVKKLVNNSAVLPVVGRPRIFNHDVTNFIPGSEPVLRLYSGRALGLSSPEDTIQLAPELRNEWSAMIHHYDRIGLSHTQDVIWDTSLTWLGKYPDHEVSVFFPNEHVAPIGDGYSWHEVVRYINSKNSFIALAAKLGMAVPATWCFDSKAEVGELTAYPYPCYLKVAVPVYGGGVYRCGTPAALHEALKTFDGGVPLQIQEEIRTGQFLTLQYAIEDGAAVRIAATEKIRYGHVRQGSRFPGRHAPWEAVEPMAQWLAAAGLRGVFDFDVSVVVDGNHFRFMPIGCNPRFNAATYPTLIAARLGPERWLAMHLASRKRHLADVDLAGIEYNGLTRAGVVIVDWGSVRFGKLGVLLAGPEELQQQLRAELERRLR